MFLPLEGIKILDLSRLLPGPFATLILGDLGADILKIEDNTQTKGDYMRWREPYLKTRDNEKINFAFYCLNRNKKSMTLNLKTKIGRKIFYKLARFYDVILESFRPGVTKKLGIDYETIKKINPKIIYCSLSGYGQTGPYSNLPSHDLNYISVAGLGMLTGEYNEHPHPPGIQVADLGGGGMNCAIAILSALIAREKLGKGQYIDVSMADGVLYWLIRKFGEFLVNKQEPKTGGERLTGALPNYNIYQAKDGKYLAVGALELKFWKNLCIELGCPQYIEDTASSGSKREEIYNFLKAKFMEKTRDEWFEQLKDKDVCVTKVNEFCEVLEDEHIKSRNMFIEFDSPKLGPNTKMVGFPFKLSDTPCKIRSDAPHYGEHTNEVLSSLGYNENDIKQFRKDKII
ncbi:MAG: CaiB/BaiF CoA transferase family protein [Candidatus Helarchaeota archaeon]